MPRYSVTRRLQSLELASRLLPPFIFQTPIHNRRNNSQVFFRTSELLMFTRLYTIVPWALLLIPFKPSPAHLCPVEAIHIAHVFPSGDAQVVAIVSAGPTQSNSRNTSPHVPDGTPGTNGARAGCSNGPCGALRSCSREPVLRLRTWFTRCVRLPRLLTGYYVARFRGVKELDMVRRRYS